MNTAMPHKPSTAFIAASWVALLLGAAAYLIGLFNATMALNEKGYYLTLLLFGLFAAVSLQKSVRDRVEGIPVSGLYYALCWFALLSALMLLLCLALFASASWQNIAAALVAFAIGAVIYTLPRKDTDAG